MDRWDACAAELPPLTAAAHLFAGDLDFPPVATWSPRLASGGFVLPVTFVVQHAPMRRRDAERAPYDAEIVQHARVPSRERSWHDFLNMLVWATFPKTKLALHRRQLEATAREATPENRGRERDALAMLDEGGVLVAGAAREVIVFGHALHEHRVQGRPLALHAAALVVPIDGSLDESAARVVATAAELLSPRALARVSLGDQSDPASPRSAPAGSSVTIDP